MTRYLPLVANVVGLGLLLVGSIVLVVQAFAADDRAGWVVVSAYLMGAGWRLAFQDEG